MEDQSLEPTERESSRRDLLTLGTVAAVAVGGVALAGSPASAAPGDNLIQGVANDAGAATTAISSTGGGSGSGGVPTVVISGSPAALRLVPTPRAKIPQHAPLGTMAVDEDGDLMISGSDFNGGTVAGWIHSTNWASQTVPVTPNRILDTRYASSRASIVEGAGNISGGKLLKGKTIVLSLAHAMNVDFWTMDATAVMANVTVAGTNGSGFLTVWGNGEKPTASSLNFFGANQILSNFVQAPVGTSSVAIDTLNGPIYSAIRIYAHNTTSVIVDVVGFVAPNPMHLGGY